MFFIGVLTLFNYTKGFLIMKIIDVSTFPNIMTPDIMSSLIGDTVTLPACVYKIRRASGIVFVNITHDKYIYQCIYIPEICQNSLNEISEGSYIELNASVKEEKRANYGIELTIKSFNVLSNPAENYPLCITQPNLTCNLTENLNNRTVAIRHPKEIAVLNIMSGVKSAFSQYLNSIGFNTVTTPKISTIPNNTTDYIKVRYFGNDCNLSMSSHYYLQMALSAFSRVYEISTHFSDVNRNSTRHLNEYTCLDFEISYNSNEYDIIKLITLLLSNCIDYLNKNHSQELNISGITLPPVSAIPAISFNEAMNVLGKDKSNSGIDPTDEAKLSVYALESFNCDFLFVTDLPVLKQPFYARENSSFILIYEGLIIAHGSENICDYNELNKAIIDRGLNPADYEAFTQSFKYGMPPHGGASIGIERFVMKLLNLENIREATLFPRDLHHIAP